MNSPEKAFEKYVESYEIDVPETMVENELQYMLQEAKHRIQYDILAGGGPHLNRAREIEDQMEEMRKAAFFEVKSALVMKVVLKEHPFTVTAEELKTAAEEIAKRQNSSIELVKRFFGEDFSGLERYVREQKAKAWIYSAERCSRSR